jgi:protein phosphatase 1 regulatory subunit 7
MSGTDPQPPASADAPPSQLIASPDTSTTAPQTTPSTPTHKKRDSMSIKGDNDQVLEQQDPKDNRPRDSKGWDGKLRIDRRSLSGGDDDADSPEPHSDAENSEDDGQNGAKPKPTAQVVHGEPVEGEELPPDEDLLEDMPLDEEDIDLVHFKVRDIPALRLERFTKLKVCYISPRY